MHIITITIKTHASAENRWIIEQDIQNWNSWAFATEYSYLTTSFQENAKGVCKLNY